MRSVSHNKQFRFGRAIVSGLEQSGIIESTQDGLDVSIHISKRTCDEDRLMRALGDGGIVTIPFSSHKIGRAV